MQDVPRRHRPVRPRAARRTCRGCGAEPNAVADGDSDVLWPNTQCSEHGIRHIIGTTDPISDCGVGLALCDGHATVVDAPGNANSARAAHAQSDGKSDDVEQQQRDGLHDPDREPRRHTHDAPDANRDARGVREPFDVADGFGFRDRRRVQ